MDIKQQAFTEICIVGIFDRLKNIWHSIAAAIADIRAAELKHPAQPPASSKTNGSRVTHHLIDATNGLQQ